MKTLIFALLMFAPVLTSANEIGRYQIVQLGSARQDQYLLDTKTGKLWTRVCFYNPSGGVGACEVSAWTTDMVIGLTHKFEDIREQVKAAKEATESK